MSKHSIKSKGRSDLMAELEKNHIKTNAQKEQRLLEIFYEENFRKKDHELFEQYLVSKVNLAHNETIELASVAGALDYTKQVASKKTATVTKQDIVIKPNEAGFNLIFYSGTNYYDKSNPQVGRVDNLTRNIIQHQLSKVSKLGQTHVIFAGDLLGNEWEMKYLRNADIRDGKIYYYGINKRKERLICDIKAYFRIAKAMNIKDIQLYLMRGAQEHKIMKELGRDILQEIVDELRLPNLHYIDEGVSLGLNVIKKGPRKKYGIMGIQTNQTGKATTIQGANRSALKDNGELNANLIFRTNSNVVGKISAGEVYNVSPQSTYLRTPRMQKPETHTRFYDVFWVNLEDDYEFSVVDGGINIFENNIDLEKKLYENRQKKYILVDMCLESVEKALSSTKTNEHERTE